MPANARRRRYRPLQGSAGGPGPTRRLPGRPGGFLLDQGEQRLLVQQVALVRRQEGQQRLLVASDRVCEMADINTMMTHPPSLPITRATRRELLLRDTLDAGLIARLNGSGVEDLQVLADRMTRCAEDRAARAAWRNGLGENPPGSGSPCKSVACSACRQRFHVSPHQTRIWHRWGESGADNDHCSFVTVHLKRLDNIFDLRGVVVEHRRQWRDLRDARSAWSSVQIEGLVECDFLKDCDVPYLPPDRAAMLPALPKIGSGSGGTWLPHSHLAVCHPGVKRAEIEAVARAFWPGPSRVDVEPFDPSKSAAENAGTVIGYGSKTRCASRVGYGSGDGTKFILPTFEQWPVTTRCEWWSAFATWRRGLEPIRLRIGAHSRCAQL